MEPNDQHPLAAWFVGNSTNAEAFSATLCVSAPTISRYLRGTRIPRPAIAQRIEELTGGAVPVDTWVRWHPSVRSCAANGDGADQTLLESGQVAQCLAGDGSTTVDPGIQAKSAQIGQSVVGGANGGENSPRSVFVDADHALSPSGGFDERNLDHQSEAKP